MVDLVTEQELSRHANVLISNAYCVKASRDGQSILTRGGSYLGQPLASANERELWTYGAGNQLVISGDFDDYPWLMQIPFGKRVAAWLNRDALESSTQKPVKSWPAPAQSPRRSTPWHYRTTAHCRWRC